jgi:hypothetical protein
MKSKMLAACCLVAAIAAVSALALSLYNTTRIDRAVHAQVASYIAAHRDDIRGLRGPAGIQGVQGPRGAQGVQGPQGLPGQSASATSSVPAGASWQCTTATGGIGDPLAGPNAPGNFPITTCHWIKDGLVVG